MRILFLASIVAVACSSPSQPAPRAGNPSERAVPVPVEREDETAEKSIGSACTPDPENLRSDCPENSACAPFPGGLCTAFCAESPCPDGAVCVTSARAGQLCLAGCASDDDCRRAEGYVCDPVWKSCSLPGVSAPKAPTCPKAAELPRRTFATVSQLSTARGPGTFQLEPAAALASNGDLTAVYITNSVPDLGKGKHINTLGVSTITGKGVVSGDREFKSDRENHFDPWMASDRRGTMYLVWMGFDGGHAPERNMQIAMSTSSDGRNWSKPVAVHDAEHDCPKNAMGCLDKPMIAIGPDKKDRRRDAIYVTYFSNPGEGMRLVRSGDGGKTFGKSVPVGESAYGDIEVGGDGDVHVVFAKADPRRGGFGDPSGSVSYTRSRDGGSRFSEPVSVSAAGEAIPFYFSNPQVVADAKRKTVYVVYPTGSPDGKWDIMLATSKNGGKDWTRIKVNDDEHCANHMTPTAVLDRKRGAVHVLWTENRGGVGRVAYARCDRGGGRCSPNEAVSDTPFAAYGFVRHAPGWLGEYYTMLVDDKRGSLHAVWTQTVEDGGIARSRIFHARGTLR